MDNKPKLKARIVWDHDERNVVGYWVQLVDGGRYRYVLYVSIEYAYTATSIRHHWT